MKNICYIETNKRESIFFIPGISRDQFLIQLKIFSGNEMSINGVDLLQNVIAKNYNNGAIIKTRNGIGFTPILAKYIKKSGYMILEKSGKPYNIDANCKKVRVSRFRRELRPYQYSAVLQWGREKTGIIKAPTGSGKTIIGNYIIKDVGLKTLILVHTIDLISVWEEGLNKCFYSPDIGIFGDKNDLQQSLNSSIVIGTYQSAIKNIDLIQKKGFGLLILDECHHVPAESYIQVMQNLLIPYRLGLTATIKRLDKKEWELFALIDGIKARISLKDLINRGYIVRPYFYKINWYDPNVKLMTELSGKEKLEKITVFKQYSACSPIKIKKLLRLISPIVQRGETFIIFADFVESANLIKDLIKRYYPRLKVRFVERKLSSDERMDIFSRLGKSYNGLVFAKLGGEGIDIPAIDNVIMLNPSKSPILFAQRTGRAMRPFAGKRYCKIYSFVLSGSWEVSWQEYSFREYSHEGFTIKQLQI